MNNDDVYGSLCRRLFGDPNWVLSSRIKLEQPGPTYFKETDDLKSMLWTELEKSGKLLRSGQNDISRRPAGKYSEVVLAALGSKTPNFTWKPKLIFRVWGHKIGAMNKQSCEKLD